MRPSYREQFGAEADAARYDREEYGKDSYGTLLWELEKAALSSLVLEFRAGHPRIHYLDFASGTGRVAAFLETQVERATAIEVSAAMADRARERLRTTEVLCRDITNDGAKVEGNYDLITAFRFFLNAEPALRQAALRALAARLADDSSWLVFNNHGNLWSIKIVGWPYHRLRHMGGGYRPAGNYLSHSQVKTMLHQAGLRVVRVMGMGVLGGKVCGHLPLARALRLEARFASMPLLRRFAQDQVYVACRGAADLASTCR
jgi:SAM-dependent methyltransferase